MIDFHDFEIYCSGIAAAIDAALVFVLLEKRNQRRLILPVFLVVLGAFFYHLGVFVHTLLWHENDLSVMVINRLAMISMALGMLMMPCAMVHGLVRISRTGLVPATPWNKRYWWCYLPMVALIPASNRLLGNERVLFLDALEPYLLGYFCVLISVSACTALGFLRLQARMESLSARQLLRTLAIVLIGLAMFYAWAFFYAVESWPQVRDQILLATVLSPLLLGLVFAYYILRFNMMQIVAERAIVYALIIVAVLGFHRIVLGDLRQEFSKQLHFDVAILELVTVLGLILIYQPVRERCGEALRYLMGERVAELRETSKVLAIEMASLSGVPGADLRMWFARALEEHFAAHYVAVFLFDDSGVVQEESGQWERVGKQSAENLNRLMRQNEDHYVLRTRLLNDEVEAIFEDIDAGVAVLIDHPEVPGLVVMGRRLKNREMTEEHLNAVVLLTEQFGITLNNSHLQADRLAAERRALQNEKLSTLGLIASSIAHEVKNPLSSIKTIVSVVSEELGDQSEHSEDLELVLKEIDRLSDSVTKTLAFARLGSSSTGKMDIARVLEETVRVMSHLAKRGGIELVLKIDADAPGMEEDEDALREIFFNLIGNSIEASSQGKTAEIHLRRGTKGVCVEIRDHGSGLPPEVQDRLFEPFVTTKKGGTGLGLYVVARRIKDIDAEIHCETRKGHGTSFRIEFGARG